MKRQSGFTLVEIAIVLVIVGLLLAGIIQGSALVNSGTAKNLANELKTVPVYVYQYQDKYRALPGDDKKATGRFPTSTPAVPVGDGNGKIDGDWNGTSGEAVNFWQHIRLAGLAAGAETGAPSNVVGGTVGVSSKTPISGMKGSFFVCSGSIQGKYVNQIDANLDDGVTNSGLVQAVLHNATPVGSGTVPSAESAINESSTYDVCMGF
jgi:prepilin-type N-terminal cleavage/methylation domain-containing protein